MHEGKSLALRCSSGQLLSLRLLYSWPHQAVVAWRSNCFDFAFICPIPKRVTIPYLMDFMVNNYAFCVNLSKLIYIVGTMCEPCLPEFPCQIQDTRLYTIAQNNSP